jgi:hypothetical protein
MESTRSLSKDGESEHHIEMSWLGTHRARIETYLCGRRELSRRAGIRCEKRGG